MIRYINYILFSILLLLFFTLGTNSKISTNLHSILPDSQNKEMLETFLKFDSNKKIFLAIKDTSKESLEKLKKIESLFLKIDGLKKVQFIQNSALIEFKQEYQLYLNPIDKVKLSTLNVEQELNKLYKSIYDSFFTTPIDKTDPFNLIQKDIQEVNLKKGRLVLKDYGFLAIYSIGNKIDSLQEYEKLYDSIKEIEKHYTDVKSFSTIYYFVENSRYIKNDGKTIALIATITLLLLYLVILKNISLLVNTFLTLGSSALLATILVTTIYPTISIFVLVFGLSISTIAIDYMFHHYFHGKYEKYTGFNKEVFLGFFTTFGAFFILSFVDFLLIKQITIFTMISLLSSYLIFSFIFPYIRFKQISSNKNILNFGVLRNRYIFFSSIIILALCMVNLKFDSNIENLNYDNKELKQTEHFFKERFQQKNSFTVLLKADTIDELIENNEKLKQIDRNLKSPLSNLISKKKFYKNKKNYNILKKLGMI
jgi:predicted exporter